MKIFTLLCFFVAVSVFSEVSLDQRVRAYLCDRDLDYRQLATEGRVIVLNDSGNKYIHTWPTDLLDKPELSQLVNDQASVDQSIQQYEVRKNLARQAAKSVALKNAETAFVAFLKSENLIASDAKTVTRDQLAVAMAVWAQLPDEQAEIKYSKYARLVKRIEISGGSEYDVWEH